MVTELSPPRPRQPLPLIAAGIIIAIVGVLQVRTLLADPSILKPYDFVEYWAAGHLLLDGENPYDSDQLVPIQRSMYDGIKRAVMMWNPPWALPLTLPFAALPWRLGQLLWLLMQLAAVLVAGDMLWRSFGGDERRRWVAWLVTLAFAPTVFVLFMGQITGLMLLGLAGFLHYWRKDRPIAAGLMGALTALKPHHLSLFALVLLLDCLVSGKTRRAVMAGAVAIIAFSILPLFWNSNVWQQYREAFARPPSDTMDSMDEFMKNSLGYRLRQEIPAQPVAAMFVPIAAGALGTVALWFLPRRRHSWEERLPTVVIISLLVTPYGAWAFDMVLLLVPFIQMAVWIQRGRSKALIVGTSLAFLILSALTVATLTEPGSQINPWIAPIVAVVYGIGFAAQRPERIDSGGS